MAQDAMCLVLYDMEESRTLIPPASNPEQISFKKGQFVSLVSADTMEYRKYYDKKAVKKTLSIPSWLNKIAEREEINFSAVLQVALKEKLGIE